MHARWNHHRREGHDDPCQMACIHIRTMPSDEDAIDLQSYEPAAVCSVQELVGAAVGCIVGAMVGAAVGCIVGAMVGAAVGCIVGAMVGAAVGCIVGVMVGAAVGCIVGPMVGAAVGCIVGGSVLGTTTSYTLESGSKMKGVHTATQQKHWRVTVFQLKKKGVACPALREQYP
ncbi:17 kda surface antigen family protein [Nannochloropsis gaditana]|uniref:17 kDa surface antigen family protein n=1 Tax=Nannochloropsis gaditana TaxID=72520 RepID=W7T169_9STRA|nr:17 kda surface antigen family protein [Nannochloropsis gaditana]